MRPSAHHVLSLVAGISCTRSHVHAHGWSSRKEGLPVRSPGTQVDGYPRSRSRALESRRRRTDGFVSLGVLASAALVALGAQVADPIIGLVITLVILRITWQAWRTVSTTDPGEMIEDT